MYYVRPLTLIYLDLTELIRPCQYQDIGQFRIKVKKLKIFLFEDGTINNNSNNKS